MKVYEAVVRTLETCGVDVLFGLAGDANLYIAHEFDARGGRYISLAHEAGTLLAAAGFASVTGRPGVATVTHGPGLTNTVTSLCEVVKHRMPTVLIVGDTPADDSDNFQDIDQRALVRATGAMLIESRTPERVAGDVVRALRLATLYRLPVVLSIPIEFQWQDGAPPRRFDASLRRSPVPPDADETEAAVAIMSGARRPLILAGRGGLEARDDLVRLANRWGAIVATTARGRQLFRGEAMDIGLFGGLATPDGLAAISDADTLLVFGASLNRWTTEKGALLAGKALIQVDDDAGRIGLHNEPDASITGDAGITARALMQLLDEAEIARTRFADEVAARPKLHESDRARTAGSPPGTVDLEAALQAIDDRFPAARNLVIDAGRMCIPALRIMSVEDPIAYVHTINFAAIGVGLPYAIGAAVGAPSRPTLLICGDGGFMLGGLAEVSTAVALELDITIAVLNDGAYGAEHVQLVQKGMDPSISLIPTPDLGSVAASLGAGGYTVQSLGDLPGVIAEARAHCGTALIDLRVSAEAISARP